MNRWIKIAAATLTVAVLAGGAAFAWYSDVIDDERNITVDYAEGEVREILYHWREDTEPPRNSWQINVRDGWSDPVGETDVEPQILPLAEPAVEFGTFTEEFDFLGDRWFSYAVHVGDQQVLLSLIDRGPQDDAIRRAAWIAALSTIGLAIAAGAVSYWWTGREAPAVQRAHSVNRDFIADAAHELRTPLAIIQASSGHALSRERTNDEYRESLEEILHATERAGASVSALLEFARLEAGQAQPRKAPLRLDLLVEEVAAGVRVDGTVIEADPGDAVVVDADDALIRQVLDNIVRNAAARAGKVVLTTRFEGQTAVVDVIDDGPGFDEQMLPHVFERFRRGDQSGTAGLGLAIARTIVDLHQGTCEATNNADQGAKLTIRLPVA